MELILDQHTGKYPVTLTGSSYLHTCEENNGRIFLDVDVWFCEVNYEIRNQGMNCSLCSFTVSIFTTIFSRWWNLQR